MTIFPQLASRIIKEQELIIGPVAWEEAMKVHGVKVIDRKTAEIELTEDEKDVLGRLVAQYERLFGRASVEVCKEAVVDLVGQVPPAQLPDALRS